MVKLSDLLLSHIDAIKNARRQLVESFTEQNSHMIDVNIISRDMLEVIGYIEESKQDIETNK
jgi:hypothetical protein